MATETKATWKWNAHNEGYLTAKGESSLNPRARVYACMARPKGSRYIWTVYAGGAAFAVSTDPRTAMTLGRKLADGTL